MLQLRDSYQGSKTQTRLILAQVLQRLHPGQTYQALIVHDIVFQLPEEITPSSDETCLLCPALEETDHLFQGRGLDELKRSHTTPLMEITGAWFLTFALSRVGKKCITRR